MTQIILSVQYDWRLVALSIGIAVYASFAAFDLAGQIARSRGRRQVLWITCGAMAMGLGMWAMQCIGMLALVLPVQARYNVPIIASSLLIAIVSSAVALFVVTRRHLSESYMIGGSVALGGGIAAMHYSGMAALELAAYPVYNSGFVALSIVIAMMASGAALQLARLPAPAKSPIWMRLLCASVMGGAMAATHYTGMAAVSFRYAQALAADHHSVSGSGLSITGIALLTIAILGLSVIGSRVDRKFTLQRQMLLSEQERWLLVSSASLDGLSDFDLVTGLVVYSPRWKAMLGYGPDELEPTQETWRRFLYSDDRQSVEDKLEQYLRSGKGALEMEYRVCHRDASIRWFTARYQAVWDEQGKPIRLVGSHSDVTARKLSEEKLQLSESRYRGLFEANPLPSWIYSPETLRIEDANKAAMEYYGWSRDQFLGLSMSSIGMPGMEAPTAGGPAPDGDGKTPWRLRRKNKSGIWVELSNYEIEGAGAPAHLMIANDVTSHVVTRNKIEHAKEQLETLLERKTEALQVVEAQWQSLAEVSSQLIWSTRPDGFCEYVNSHWSEYSGVPSSELLGSGWLGTLHPADRPVVEDLRLKALATGEAYKLEYRVREKGGVYSWFDAQVVPVRAAADKPITSWLGSANAAKITQPRPKPRNTGKEKDG